MKPLVQLTRSKFYQRNVTFELSLDRCEDETDTNLGLWIFEEKTTTTERQRDE